MRVRAFPSGMLVTNAYVIDDEQHRAAIIDPAPGSASAIKQWVSEQQLTIEVIIITHSHWDHFADCHELKKHYHAPVMVNELDAPNLRSPGVDGLPMFEAIEGVEPDQFLVEGQVVKIGTTKWRVIHTPGHCPGSVCLYCEEEGTLISGDLIFQGGIGNLSLPTGEPEKMVNSLSTIAQLPAKTVVYPGHGEITTIGEEVPSWEFL